MAFKNTIARITNAFAGPIRQKVENEYLSGSVSLVDLELRQREIDRGRFRNF